jgi:hypothetical protein
MTKFYTQETQKAIRNSELEAEKFYNWLENSLGDCYDYDPEEEEEE